MITEEKTSEKVLESPNSPSSKIGKILEDAADYLDMYGWMNCAPKGFKYGTPACAVVAIQHVAGIPYRGQDGLCLEGFEKSWRADYYAAYRALAKYLKLSPPTGFHTSTTAGRAVYQWNDEQSGPQTVTRAMREAAAVA